MASVSKSKAGLYQKRIQYDNAVKAHLICIFFSLHDSLKLRASLNKKNIKSYVNCYRFFVTRFHIVNIFLKCDLL